MSLANVPLGDKAPELINVVIEIPKGSHVKYEFDEELGVIVMDRMLHSAVFYPTDYGFIPGTRGGDGDHLDALVIVSEPLIPGCVVQVRPIGVLDMEDDQGEDFKIVAVADADPKLKTVESMDDLDEHYRREIQHFFEVYKHLENKSVNVKGWLPREDAFKIISDSQE